MSLKGEAMKRTLVRAAALGVILACCGCSGGGPGRQEQGLAGGGSSFINPVMTRWAGVYYKDKGIRIDYTSSGSGNGIQQMLDHKNDFGCTDAPMNDDQLAKARGLGGEVIHVPLVMGGVVPAYNLKGSKEPLHFTGPVLADIFLGKIKKWNDPRIRDLNKSAELPDQEIGVVHRSDGSGTTYIFADYLSKVSPEWKNQVGVGTDLKWPAGVGVPKNDGVAAQIARTPGGLGYVELTYALNSSIPYGAVENREGEFVRADLQSVTRAAEGALKDIPEDLRYSLTNAPGKGGYPICGTTWAVLYTQQKPGKGKLLKDFLHWATHDGQGYPEELQYARLPAGLVQRIDQKLEKIQSGQ